MYSRATFFNIFITLLAFNVQSTNQQLFDTFLSLNNNLNKLVQMNEFLNAFNRTWAVLVAGSAGFDNYRHQADVLHIYKILTTFSKIPKDKIILMITDDIANSSINPSKGVIVNEPNGENLYQDLDKDYTGSEVTVENFLKVLKGDPQLAAKGKKVLNSKSDENVLIYYSDHGSQGFLLFPDDILSATRFNDALEDLAKRKKFNKMLISLEACYSGSIFNQNLLKSNLSIYAMTASNSKEESYAVFYDSKRETFLADVFTQNWMHSWISCEENDSTIAQQYELIRNSTNTSHVSQFGDLKLARSTKINDFVHPSIIPGIVQQKCSPQIDLNQNNTVERLVSPNSDVKLIAYEHLAKQDKLKKHHFGLIEKLKKGRHQLKEHIFRLGNRLAKFLHTNTEDLMNHDEPIKDRACYERLVHVYHDNCFKLNENTYLSRYLQLFFKACNSLMNDKDKVNKTKFLEQAIIEECKSERMNYKNSN